MAQLYYQPNPFDLWTFVESIAHLDVGAMSVTTDKRKREVAALSYRVNGAPAARRRGSERFIQQLENLGLYRETVSSI